MEQALTSTAGQLDGSTAVPDAELAANNQAMTTSSEAKRAAGHHVYAGRSWASDHPLNVRLTIPFGGGSYYITVVAGKERRARARLALDRRRNPLDTPGNVLFLTFISMIAAAGSITLLYLFMAHVFNWPGRLLF